MQKSGLSRMLKMAFSLFSILTFLLTHLSTPAFAAQAIILSDAELDSVHAEGLFLNFDRAFASVNDVINKGADGSSQKPSSSTTTVTNNPGLQFVKIITPSTPIKPAPVASTPQLSASSSGNTAPILTPTNPAVSSNSLINLPLITNNNAASTPVTNTQSSINPAGLQVNNIINPLNHLPAPESTANAPISILDLPANITNEINPQKIALTPDGTQLSSINNLVAATDPSHKSVELVTLPQTAPASTLNQIGEISDTNDLTQVSNINNLTDIPDPVSNLPLVASEGPVSMSDLATTSNTSNLNNAAAVEELPLNKVTGPVDAGTFSSLNNQLVNNVPEETTTSPAALNNLGANPTDLTSNTASSSTTSNINSSPNVLPPVQFDLVATQGSDGFDVSLQMPQVNTPQMPEPEIPQAPIIPEVPTTPTIPTAVLGNGNNIVNVSDQSQQYLSSLINVNAAGSIVPVTLNITINFNSTIDTLTNSNNINISNFNNFSFQ